MGLKPGLISSLFKQTNKQTFLKPLNVPATYPSLAPCVADVTHPMQFSSHCLLSPHCSGFCLHFYSPELLMSASPVSSVWLNPVVCLHFSSYLNLKQYLTVFDDLSPSSHSSQGAFWTPRSVGFPPPSLVASPVSPLFSFMQAFNIRVLP